MKRQILKTLRQTSTASSLSPWLGHPHPPTLSRFKNFQQNANPQIYVLLAERAQRAKPPSNLAPAG